MVSELSVVVVFVQVLASVELRIVPAEPRANHLLFRKSTTLRFAVVPLVLLVQEVPSDENKMVP